MEDNNYTKKVNSDFERYFDEQVSDFIDEPLTPTQIKILCRAVFSQGVITGIELSAMDSE